MRQLIREHPVINYFIEHYTYYGFDSAIYNGLGHDFTLSLNGEIICAELETRWQNYLSHRHHLDDRFTNVSLLILFAKDDPPDNINGLPPNILHIDLDHFFEVIPSSKVYYSRTNKIRHGRFRVVGIRVNKDMRDRLATRAIRNNKTVSQYCYDLIRNDVYRKGAYRHSEINPGASDKGDTQC